MLSVTQVLEYFAEPELVAWQLKVGKVKAQQIGDAAKRIGSLVDMAIQQDLRGQGLVIPANEPEIASCLEAWMRFKKDRPDIIQAISGIQPELTDGEIVGHPDIETSTDSAWSIGDVKTSGMIRPKYWTQTAAYGYLRSRMMPMPIRPWHVWILRLDKQKGQYEYKEMRGEQVEYEVGMWQHYLAIYRHGQKVREWMLDKQEEEVLGYVA